MNNRALLRAIQEAHWRLTHRRRRARGLTGGAGTCLMSLFLAAKACRRGHTQNATELSPSHARSPFACVVIAESHSQIRMEESGLRGLQVRRQFSRSRRFAAFAT